MSGILWARRPSAPDTGGASVPPRPRTTSGGGLAAFAGSVLSLSKAKSRERLRTGPRPSSNRQTVVSTESGSSDMWNEPTTPSSASETKQSFQGIGVGVGDDPFARPPVYVSKDKPESPVPSLAAFPDPPARHARTATARTHSTGPLLFPDPGPSRHLHPPSPKSSRTSSPSRSRSTSSSSVNPSAKSPRTPPPVISSVSTADMHAHADAFSWTESIYDPQVDIRTRYEHSRPAQEMEREQEPSIRRGQSAHAVLASSSRLPPTPRLIHSASSSHLSSPPRAGSSTSGMSSMTALASGIVQGLDEEPRKRPPKRPSRSELRDRSDVRSYLPPERKASLQALRDGPRSPASIAQILEPPVESITVPRSPSVPRSPGSSVPRSPESIAQVLDPIPRSPDLITRTLDSLDLTPRSPSSPPRHPRPRTASSPSRQQTTSPRPGTSSSRGALGPRPRNPTSPRLLPSSPRLHPSSPRLLPSTRLSEDSLEDLDNYLFTIAPTIQEGDAQSISFSELGFQLADDDDVWSDDGVTFHHGPTDSLHYVSAETSRYGAGPSRRPPPSPTSLPFMAGNARRRPRHDMVYPSGVHTIPLVDQRALARLGKEEDIGKEEEAVVGQSQLEGVPASIEEEDFPTPSASSPSPVNPLERIPSMSTGSHTTSSCSSIAPETVPQTVSSYVAFSRHARTSSYSDSELDLDLNARVAKPLLNQHAQSTQTAVAWGCGARNYEKCCATRAVQEGPNAGQFKCCAERTAGGKNARCCASAVGIPCASSGAELKRQRSLHFGSLAHAPVRKGFFHRPHTSHGKSTSSALLDDETRAIIHQSKMREDPGPTSPSTEVFASGSGAVVSPPTSPMSRHEFKAKPIISPAKLQDHLKETRASSNSPAPATPDPPTLEPAVVRARSNTATTESGSVSARSVFSNQSEDAPAPMKSLFVPPRQRRNQNVSLPPMSISQPVQQPRRYTQSITGSLQSAGLTRPQPVDSGAGFMPLARTGLPPPPRTGLSPPPRTGLAPSPRAGLSPSPRTGLPPSPRTGLPQRRDMAGRANTQPIVSFISSRSAPTPHAASETAVLRHRSSRESYESSRTVRRERSIPLRENQMSFLEFGVEEEDTDEEDEPGPALSHQQSFLDFSRQSGDTMREQEAMFS